MAAYPHAYRRTVAAVALLALWEALGRITGLRPDIVPTPSRIVLEIFREGSQFAWMAWATASELLAGLLAGTALALPVALLLDRRPGLRESGATLFASARALPLPAVAPLFFVWFGYGRTPKMLVAAFLCWIWLSGRLLDALRSIPSGLDDLAASMGATAFQTFRHFRAPASLPAFFTGLKSASAAALVGVVVAEFVAGDIGLGHLALSAAFRLNTPQICAALAVLLALAVLVDAGLSTLELVVVRRGPEPSPLRPAP